MSDLKERLRNAAYKRDGFDAVYLAEPAAARIEELEAEVLTWRKVAQSATPGGSEYMHPERVKAHISEMRESLHNARCDAVKQKRRAEAAEAKLATVRNDALEEAAKAAEVWYRNLGKGTPHDEIRALKSTIKTLMEKIK